MFETILVAISIAAAPKTSGAENAWAEWSRWEGFMEPLDSGVLKPAQSLASDSRIRQDQLDRARVDRDALDLSVKKLRRGLQMSGCAKPRDDAVRVLRVADAAAMRALLAAEDGEDFSPIVLDLFSVGRRLGTCPAGLLALKMGLILEQRARTLAEWGANNGLYPEASRRRILAAAARDPLGLADLERALEAEEKEALSLLLPPMGRAENLYSRRDTELLLAEKFRILRRSLAGPKPNLAEVEADVRSLVTQDEREFLRELQELSRQGLPPEKLEALYRLRDDKEALRREFEDAEKKFPKEQLEALMKRPISKNVMGRFLVQMLLGGLVTLSAETSAQLSQPMKFDLPVRTRSVAWMEPASPSR